MSLTLCLVTRNEEDRLAQAITSARALVDEVIVADTGSWDGTVAIAERLGAKVRPHDWQDDFAAARNFALDQARGDWILWLNPDEQLYSPNASLLQKCMSRPDVLAFYLAVQEVTSPDRPWYGLANMQPRLFRRDPALRYLGRLHPVFAPPLHETALAKKMKLEGVDLRIRHHAYLSTLTEDKLRWVVRLLELELHDRPGRLPYLIEYGRTLLLLNDPKGHEVLGQAAHALATRAADAEPPDPTVGPLLEYLLTVSSEQRRGPIEPSVAADMVRRWFPRTPPLVFTVAQRAFQAGDYATAIRHLEDLIYMGQSGDFDHRAAFDPDIVGELAYLNLGKCHLKSGDLNKAEACFGHVMLSPNHGREAREHYQLAQKLKQGQGA